MNHNSIDENLGKTLKAERVHRLTYGIKLIIASIVFVAAVVVVVFF